MGKIEDLKDDRDKVLLDIIHRPGSTNRWKKLHRLREEIRDLETNNTN